MIIGRLSFFKAAVIDFLQHIQCAAAAAQILTALFMYSMITRHFFNITHNNFFIFILIINFIPLSY